MRSKPNAEKMKPRNEKQQLGSSNAQDDLQNEDAIDETQKDPLKKVKRVTFKTVSTIGYYSSGDISHINGRKITEFSVEQRECIMTELRERKLLM